MIVSTNSHNNHPSTPPHPSPIPYHRSSHTHFYPPINISTPTHPLPLPRLPLVPPSAQYSRNSNGSISRSIRHCPLQHHHHHHHHHLVVATTTTTTTTTTTKKNATTITTTTRAQAQTLSLCDRYLSSNQPSSTLSTWDEWLSTHSKRRKKKWKMQR